MGSTGKFFGRRKKANDVLGYRPQGGRILSPCPLVGKEWKGKEKVNCALGYGTHEGRHLPPCPVVGRTRDGSHLGPTCAFLGKREG